MTGTFSMTLFSTVCVLTLLFPYFTSATDCGYPGLPRNGLVDGTSKVPNHTSYSPGTEVVYTCDGENVKRFGLARRSCQNDGTWSGHRPSCLTNVLSEKPVVVSLQGSTRTLSRLTLNSTAREDWDSCLLVNGGDKLSVILPHKSSQGDIRILVNTKEPFAGQVETQPNMAVSVRTSTLPAVVLHEKHSNLERNKTSFNISSSESFDICDIEAYISDVSDCGIPEVPLHGSVSYKNFDGAEVATYSCDSGYKLAGSATRKCNGDHWTGQQAICIKSNDDAPELVIGTSTASLPLIAHRTNQPAVQETPDWKGGNLLVALLYILILVGVVIVVLKISPFFKHRRQRERNVDVLLPAP